MTTKNKAVTRREAIRSKVAASQAELANRGHPSGEQPPEGLKALATDYPFALMFGGLALGAVAGALLPRLAGRRLSKGALAVASVAGELGLLYGRQALEKAADAARDGRDKLGALGETVTEGASAYGRKAAELGSDAGEKVAELAGDAATTARGTGAKIAEQVIRLTSHLLH